jgi:hypothetical protein
LEVTVEVDSEDAGEDEDERGTLTTDPDVRFFTRTILTNESILHQRQRLLNMKTKCSVRNQIKPSLLKNFWWSL